MKTVNEIMAMPVNERDAYLEKQQLEADQKSQERDDRLQRLEDSLREVKTKAGRLKSGDTGTLSFEINQQAVKDFADKKTSSLRLETKAMSISSNLTNGLAAVSAPAELYTAPGVLPLRNLFASRTIGTERLPVVVESSRVGDFGTVAEGGTKPTVEFTLSEELVKVQTIAAVTTITRQMLYDIPDFQRWLQTRLIDMYYRKENQQIVQGNATNPNLSGLMSFPFTSATAPFAGVDIEQLVKGVLQMRSYGRNPSAVIINHNAMESILLNKANTSGVYDYPPFVSINGTLPTILGVPVIATEAQLSGQFNIIDGARIDFVQRDPISVEFFPQHGNNVVENKITVRVEARVALAVASEYDNIIGGFAADPYTYNG